MASTDITTLGVDEQGRRYGIYERDRVHIAVFGLPGTGKSCGRNVKIFVYDTMSKKLFYMPIGEFIHKTLSVPHVPGTWTTNGQFLALSLSADMRVEWRKITAVHVHPAPPSMIQVTTKYGNILTVTEDHSLMSLKEGKVMPIAASKFSLGKPLITPKIILPPESSSLKIANVEFDDDLAAIFGYYVSEGYSDPNKQHYLRITNSNPQVLEDIVNCGERLGLHTYVWHGRNKAYADVYLTDELAREGASLFGRHSGGKKIPAEMFGLPSHTISSFLKRYFSGDGGVELDKKNNEVCVCATSKSRALAERLVILLRRLGIFATLHLTKKRATNGKAPKTTYFQVVVSGVDNVKGFAERVGFVQSEKQLKLQSVIARSDVKVSNPSFELIPSIDHILKDARTSLLLSQVGLCERARLGVNYVSRIESCERQPACHCLGLLASALRNRLEELKVLSNDVPILMKIADLESFRSKVCETKGEKGLSYQKCAGLLGVYPSVLYGAFNLEMDTPYLFDGASVAFDDEHLGYDALIERVHRFEQGLIPNGRTFDASNMGKTLRQVRAGGRKKEPLPSTLSKIAGELLAMYRRADLTSAEALVKRLERLADSEVVFDPIVNVEKIESDWPLVYDLSVDENENFFADGVFAHNSTLLLHLILQNIKKGESVVVLDPHGDLISKLLTHIPREKWDKVIYVDPMTAFKYGRVVQLNFLEYKNDLERDLVARTFMDSLAKIYSRFWGPRLDMILMNAIYALLEAGKPTIGDVYRVISDADYREGILARVRDAKIRSFWESEYKTMPRDASASVLTKIYRIVQEKLLQPMFECEKSSIDFRDVIDNQKIMIVNLMEGVLTTDLVNFIGSLILARIYLAGMGRVDTPETNRPPAYVYVDEAHRFMTSSVNDMLQALRKYRVYSTIAAQHLEQYREDIATSIPSLCSTIICFATGKTTAKQIEGYFTPIVNADDIQHFPMFWAAVSTMVKGVRETMAIQCIDEGFGKTNPEELIKYALQKTGKEVDVGKIVHPPEVEVSLDYPELSPIMWLALVRLRLDGKMEKEEITRTLTRAWGFNASDVYDALSSLVLKSYVLVDHQVSKQTEKIEAPDGSVKYHQVKKVAYYYKVSPLAVRLFFSDIPVSPRAGGDEHLAMMATIISDLRSAGFFCFPDLGGEGVKQKPDILVYPVEKKTDDFGKVRVNPRMWDTPHMFAIEVETNPMSYKDRVVHNWTKNRDLKLPVIFAVKNYEILKALEEFLKTQGAPIVNSVQQQYAPGNVQVIFVEQGTRVALPELFERLTTTEPEAEAPVEEAVTTEETEEPVTEEKRVTATAEFERVKARAQELIAQGFTITKKIVKNKVYLIARKGDKQTSLGRLTPELEKLLQLPKPKPEGTQPPPDST
jgi:intein/homing endonuclease